MQDLPIGIQTFEDIRNEDFIYVDKTKHLFNLYLILLEKKEFIFFLVLVVLENLLLYQH